MGALFSCVQRADDPSKSLTFPYHKTKKPQKRTLCSSPVRGMMIGLNTVKDFCWSLWKSTFGVDDVSPVRSGEIGIEFRPITIFCNEFGLDDIKRIKDKIGGVCLNLKKVINLLRKFTFCKFWFCSVQSWNRQITPLPHLLLLQKKIYINRKKVNRSV